ncbi:MAG TPA: glycoside hydrolase family 3 N-terminal domain-containing protein [Candidatus Acidoferrum sp.]|nr:glycoside hydrolase family 3 N-terminal domain-containing protein [Candidatus Acidoferrum sp.]
MRTKTRVRKAALAVLAVVFTLGTTGTTWAQDAPAYKNAKLSVDERVADLLARMTLDEKLAQIDSAWENGGFVIPGQPFFVDKDGKFLPEAAKITLKNGLGQVSRPSENPGGRPGPREMAQLTNDIQKWVIENTRLAIPVMFHEECLHGHTGPKGTSFPAAIGLASTWDPALIKDVFSSVASEVRARGAQECLAPVLDLARDPRWGRTEETYGEDPYLVTKIGLAAIHGFQGDGPWIDKSHVMATAKHFAVHGQPEGGTNVGTGNLSERVVREYFLKPFEAAVKEGHVQTLMASYNEIDGIPSHSNKHLLDDILRHEWGFHGLVVSDYFGIDELIRVHHVAPSLDVAAKMSLDAGVDIELPFTSAYPTLKQQVEQGKVSVAMIDRAAGRVLRAKFIARLFDDPFVDPAFAEKITNSPEHQQLALKAAHETIVLLKNQNNLLPLDKSKLKRIAVIGPNAGELHLGGYSGKPGRGVSILQGIKDKVGSGVEVLYAEGCKITESLPDWDADKVVLGDPTLNAKRIAEAVAVAKKADAVVLVIGENEQTSREAWAKNHLGDRLSLDLLGNQDDLAKQIVATGKPVVALLLHGRPNSINYVAENVPAILDGWYLGQEGGTAAADVIFGDYNPGGKLPITVPRSVGQLPDYYYQKPSAKRGFVDGPVTPLFPFGWGLSYTTFKYSNLKLAQDSIGPEGDTKVTIDVTNTGKVRGDEVAQLYIHQLVSSVTRPVKELRGFERISLNPGETKTVEFSLGPKELAYLNRDMKRVVEPGTFEIMAGGNSEELITTVLTVLNR